MDYRLLHRMVLRSVQQVMQLSYMAQPVPSQALAFRQEGDKAMSGYVQGRSLGSMILQS